MSAVNCANNWRLIDPCPDTEIHSIVPISARAAALIARAQGHPLLQEHFLRLAGSVHILQGMEYHHDRFLGLIDGLASGAVEDPAPLRHEAIAYLNRVGQYWYFAKSDFVVQQLGVVSIPRLDELMMLRNKHAAHRSIDNPRKADTEHAQEVHAMCMSGYGGSMWIPKEPIATEELPRPHWGRAYLVFQMHTEGSNDIVEFVLERDHYEIIKEAYGVIEALLNHT